MLKKQIKYKGYENEDLVTTLYFHLNKFEWLELETFTTGGLIENLKTALETNDAKKTINILKKIILTAYGEKNEETNEFEKSDAIAIRFSKTDAFSALFYELAFDEGAAKEFFLGLVPPEMKEETEKRMNAAAKVVPLQQVDTQN